MTFDIGLHEMCVRVGGREYATSLPNFLAWIVYQISLPMVLRCACARAPLKTDNIVGVEESGPIEEYAPVLIDFGKAKRATETKVKRLPEREKAFYRKYHSYIAPEVMYRFRQA